MVEKTILNTSGVIKTNMSHPFSHVQDTEDTEEIESVDIPVQGLFVSSLHSMVT